MSDKYDGLTIGDLITEDYIQNTGRVNSKMLGKAYNLIDRVDLTSTSDGVKRENDSDVSSVYEVVKSQFHESGAIINLDYVHEKVHMGELWDAQYVFPNIASGSNVQYHITATTKDLHIVFTTSVGAECEFKTYTGTTYTDDGTPINIFNRIVDTITGSTAEVFHTPIIDTLGTQRFDQFIPGGSGQQATGNISSGSRVESIIKAGEDLLIDVTNLSNQSIYIGVSTEWYEENE